MSEDFINYDWKMWMQTDKYEKFYKIYKKILTNSNKVEKFNKFEKYWIISIRFETSIESDKWEKVKKNGQNWKCLKVWQKHLIKIWQLREIF